MIRVWGRCGGRWRIDSWVDSCRGGASGFARTFGAGLLYCAEQEGALKARSSLFSFIFLFVAPSASPFSFVFCNASCDAVEIASRYVGAASLL